MESLAEHIDDLFSERETSAEYKLQVEKVCELERELRRGLSEEQKEQLKTLNQEQDELDHIYRIEILKFAVKFIKNIMNELK